jgi:hypothetical protein
MRNFGVREDGRITVVVRHLVIPGRVAGNPVATLAASLVCDDMVVDSTRPFAVSPDGNGRIRDRITAVDECDNPAVLVSNATNPAALGAYFAVAMADGRPLTRRGRRVALARVGPTSAPGAVTCTQPETENDTAPEPTRRYDGHRRWAHRPSRRPLERGSLR